jgi:hypothetical protein
VGLYPSLQAMSIVWLKGSAFKGSDRTFSTLPAAIAFMAKRKTSERRTFNPEPLTVTKAT